MRLLILICSLSLAFVACTKKSKVDYDLNLNETLRWGISAEPPTLDWHLGTDTTSSRIVDNLMEGLVSYDFTGGEVVSRPALATAWSSSPDMKKWTFNIRQNVNWSDGVPFTAQQVIDGWERLLNPKTGAEYASMLFNIKNAKAYFEGRITNFNEVGAKVNDKGQIEVVLELPQSFFPSILAHHSTFPIRKDVVEKHGVNWTEPQNFVGIGPFRLKLWEHDKALILERNDDYYGEKAKIKYVLARIIRESSTAYNMFKKGELDAMDDLPSVEMAQISQMPEFQTVPLLAFQYLGFNVKMPPFDNVKVRKAFNMAVDRTEIIKLLKDKKIPATNVVPPGLNGHDAKIGVKFDPQQAADLMDQAGYKDRKKFPRAVLIFNTNQDVQRIMENVQGQIKKNLGVEIELQNEEWKTYLKTLQTKNYQMFRMSWVGDYPEAETFLEIFKSDSGNNRTQFSDTNYDETLRLAALELDKNKRAEHYKKAQKILNEEATPLIPFYYSTIQALVNKRIKNYPINNMNKFFANKVEVVPADEVKK